MGRGPFPDAATGTNPAAHAAGPAAPRRIDIGAGDDTAAFEELKPITGVRELAPQALFLTGMIERRRKRLRYAEAAYRNAVNLDPALSPPARS